MTAHCIRLRRGEDLLGSISAFAKARGIRAGAVLSGVGCVSRARVRDASGVTVQAIEEPLEIVSMTGTMSEKRCHIHGAFSKTDLSVVGGHLVEGCTVNTTCELVVAELDGIVIDLEFDEETGYDELIFRTL